MPSEQSDTIVAAMRCDSRIQSGVSAGAAIAASR